MNEDILRRARNARLALEAFQNVAGIDNDEEALSDLIADLGHFADRHGIEFIECCSRAIAAWAEERQGTKATATTPSVVIQIGGVR